MIHGRSILDPRLRRRAGADHLEEFRHPSFGDFRGWLQPSDNRPNSRQEWLDHPEWRGVLGRPPRHYTTGGNAVRVHPGLGDFDYIAEDWYGSEYVALEGELYTAWAVIRPVDVVPVARCWFGIDLFRADGSNADNGYPTVMISGHRRTLIVAPFVPPFAGPLGLDFGVFDFQGGTDLDFDVFDVGIAHGRSIWRDLPTRVAVA